MKDHLQKYEKNRKWKKVQRKIDYWTKDHWEVINSIRQERNEIAHPGLIDIDLVENEVSDLSPKYQRLLNDMFDMLKMTASLMKFGRLANRAENIWKRNLKISEQEVLKHITSWDRTFEQIGGLQSIDHDTAKKYLKKYVGKRNPKLNHYFSVVDSLKEENGKWLGKLASDFLGKALTSNETKVLKEFMKLLSKEHQSFEAVDCSTATLHVPDFLPKELWEDGIKLWKRLFEPPTSTTSK